MLIPSYQQHGYGQVPSLSRRVNANSQLGGAGYIEPNKLIKKGEC